MLSSQEMHKQELEVKEAETRAYQKVLDIIERMMDPEPYLEDNKKSEKYRKWERDTRTLRALKCDVLEEFIQVDKSRAYYAQVVKEERDKEIEEARKKADNEN